jgi:hypothetical protein
VAEVPHRKKHGFFIADTNRLVPGIEIIELYEAERYSIWQSAAVCMRVGGTY